MVNDLYAHSNQPSFLDVSIECCSTCPSQAQVMRSGSEGCHETPCTKSMWEEHVYLCQGRDGKEERGREGRGRRGKRGGRERGGEGERGKGEERVKYRGEISFESSVHPRPRVGYIRRVV